MSGPFGTSAASLPSSVLQAVCTARSSFSSTAGGQLHVRVVSVQRHSSRNCGGLPTVAPAGNGNVFGSGVPGGTEAAGRVETP